MVDIITGLQLGDEGKGRVVDYYAKYADLILRCSGGDNAGHSVIIKDDKYKFHLIPVGILRNIPCILGADMVVNPKKFMEEIETLHSNGISTDNVYIDGSAHLNFHNLYSELDKIEESRRKTSIGTTSRGIGPCYSAKYARKGLQAWSVLQDIETFKNSMMNLLTNLNLLDNATEFIEEAYEYAIQLTPYINNTKKIVRDYLNAGRYIIVEGAQGTFLDINCGQYPFVTSSCTLAAGALLGTGIGIKDVDKVIGVTKAYSTYVGNGEYVAEADEINGNILRERGGEYGTTTGRPRRCGWLDMCMLRDAVMYNSVDDIVLTKIDILKEDESFKEFKVVTYYNYNGHLLDTVPSNPFILRDCIPVYNVFPAFKNPESEKEIDWFLAYLEEDLRKYRENVEIKYVSYGPERDQMMEV